MICDWDGIEAEENELRALMSAAGSEPVHPFAVLGMGSSAAEQGQVARAFAAPAIDHRREDFAGAKKLRKGYLSSDFCRHAAALLMAELFGAYRLGMRNTRPGHIGGVLRSFLE